MIYVFDLDHTLCVPNLDRADLHGRYVEAVPIREMIDMVARLRQEGHTIVIHTARRMLTNKGNVAAVCDEVGQLTVDWLTKHGVRYNDLVFGKPYGDYYVDDKAIRPEELLAAASVSDPSCG